jgi:hypothetical protein
MLTATLCAEVEATPRARGSLQGVQWARRMAPFYAAGRVILYRRDGTMQVARRQFASVIDAESAAVRQSFASA